MALSISPMGEGSPRAKAGAAAIAGCIAALVLLDFVVLEGEHVARMQVRLDGSEPGVFEVARPGEPHLVEIETRRHSGGETKGRSIRYRLTGPGDVLVAEESELVSRKRRYVRFTPSLAGSYRVELRDEARLFGPSSRSATVSVRVGDRRILPRLSF